MEKRLKSENIISAALLVGFVCILIWGIVNLIPLFRQLIQDISDERSVVATIREYKIRGIVVILAMQALQVVTTVFPSAVIQVLAGLTYGVFYGMLICLAGYMLGNAFVFEAVRLVDRIFAKQFARRAERRREKKGKPKWDFSFLKKSNNAGIIAFALFLIPGIPNGVLPYIFAKTSLTLPRYLTSIFLAGIPSILICSVIGERIASGDWFTAVLLIALLLAAAVWVILSRNRILQFLQRFGRRNAEQE